MWIIIILMIHALVQCNLKAIMRSVTFSSNHQRAWGATCHFVSPEPVGKRNMNKIWINHRRRLILTRRSGRVNVLINAVTLSAKQEVRNRLCKNITLHAPAQIFLPVKLILPYAAFSKKCHSQCINRSADSHTCVHTQTQASSFATGCCFPAV